MSNKKEGALRAFYFRHWDGPNFSIKFCKTNRIEASKDRIAPRETGMARHKSFASKKEFASKPSQMAPPKNVTDEINSPTDLPFRRITCPFYSLCPNSSYIKSAGSSGSGKSASKPRSICNTYAKIEATAEKSCSDTSCPISPV